jgi:hypothetical protein
MLNANDARALAETRSVELEAEYIEDLLEKIDTTIRQSIEANPGTEHILVQVDAARKLVVSVNLKRLGYELIVLGAPTGGQGFVSLVVSWETPQ